MVQLAARGLVNFELADPYNRSWQRKLKILMNAAEAQNLEVAQRLNFEQALSYTSNSALSADSFKAMTQEANQAALSIKKLRFPWIDFDPKSALLKDAAKLSEQWIAAFGDPNDPAVKAQIDATAAWLNAGQPAQRRERHGRQ
jgi:hypothetical protein